MMTGFPHRWTPSSIRRHLVVGLAAVFVLVGGIGGLAATTELAGAVIAPGVLVVESDVKKVQHPTGGVVAELNVREGDDVVAGEIVIRLDQTVAAANHAVVAKSLDQLEARQARLEAERDATEAIVFPGALLDRATDNDVQRLVQGEATLFEHRRRARNGQKAQLAERIRQLGDEIKGLTSQIGAKGREIGFIEEELVGLRDLRKKGLVTVANLNALLREAARLDGERGQLIAATAQARGKVGEIELQIIQIDQDLRSEVATELREIQGKIAELVERKIAAEDQLSRIDIRAPQNGKVHQLAVHTIGGVASPGEVLMLIVPVADALAIEVRVAPQDIDQVKLGQATLLRFSAFNQRTTPEVNGVVSRMSADLTIDQRTGLSYYTGRITLADGELSRLHGLILAAGMPVEAFIQTGQRTILSYLTKPLTDNVMRSFRGD
jgi:HlyD family secretion protein